MEATTSELEAVAPAADVAGSLAALESSLEDAPASRVSRDEGAAERRRATVLHRDAIYRRGLALADALSVGLALYLSAVVFGHDQLTWATGAAVIVVVGLAKVIGLYDRDEHLLLKSTVDEIPALFELSAISTLIIYLAGSNIVNGFIGRDQALGMWALLFGGLMLGRALARFGARKVTPAARCLLVCDDPSVAEEFGQKLARTHGVNAQLVACVSASDLAGSDGHSGADLAKRFEPLFDQAQINRVILAPGPADPAVLLDTIRQIRGTGVKVSVLPGTSRILGSALELDHLHGTAVLGVRGFEMTRSSRLVKRVMDLAGSLGALIVLSPLLLAIAVAIRVDSGGAALFRQVRIGRRGKRFEMLKFRSMVENAESQKQDLHHLNEADGLFKISDDPRVTRVGRFLRRFSLDELPQLANVVRGEMSLVGPRPLVPEEDARVQGPYRSRLDLAPGMTGYWQALGSARIPLSEMVKLDYLYVADWSLWNDIKILMRTVPHVAGRRGL